MDLFTERFLPLIESSEKSDTELEVEMGLPRSIIYDWKHGRSKGYKKYASNFSTYFNVPLEKLLGVESTPEKPTLTDDEIKFALFNGADNITDEMYEEVKSFAAYVQQREDQKQKGKK